MRMLMFLIVVGMAVALSACGGAASSTGAQETTIVASEFKFQPATVEVNAGRPVKLTFRNQGSVEHDWSIMEMPMMGTSDSGQTTQSHDMTSMDKQPQLHTSAMMGQAATLEFTPTQPGTYQFFCTVPGHKEAGMLGNLVVNAP